MKLYLLESENYLKVGITTNVKERIRFLNGGSVPFAVWPLLVVTAQAKKIRPLERMVLNTASGRCQGEWFCKKETSVERLMETIHASIDALYRSTFFVIDGRDAVAAYLKKEAHLLCPSTIERRREWNKMVASDTGQTHASFQYGTRC